jgi:uncharacterized protein YndB with AHSA1/START domain
MSQNRIEKHIELKAPVSKVWKALTTPAEFGAWFGVKMETSFAEGKPASGNITYPGYEHVKWQVVIEKIEPEHTFSFRWHPYAVEEGVDYSKETPTLVEFKLKPTATGTLLTVVESGFENIPEHRRLEAFRMNEGGWAEQMTNIEKYVSA